MSLEDDSRANRAMLEALLIKVDLLSSKLEAVEAKQPPALLRAAEVDERYKISPSTLRRWRRSGRIRSVQIGRTRLYDVSTLRAYSAAELDAVVAEARR